MTVPVWIHNWIARSQDRCQSMWAAHSGLGWAQLVGWRPDGWRPHASNLSLNLLAASTLSAERGLSGPQPVRLGQGPWEDSRSGWSSVWLTWSPPNITMKRTRRKHSRQTLKSWGNSERQPSELLWKTNLRNGEYDGDLLSETAPAERHKCKTFLS